MARPRTVRLDTFPQYDKLHTQKVKQRCGIEITALYPVRETKKFFVSIQVWAFCASYFKAPKDRTTLSVNIPVVQDEKTVAFLKEHCWENWVTRELEVKDKDIIEAVVLLDKLFPGKEKIFFYELTSLITAYCHGNFVRYDENGNIEEPWENDIKNRKYYTHKYSDPDTPEINAARKKYFDEKNEKLKKELYKVYSDLMREWAYEHNNLTDVFIQIGQNIVCYPVAFSNNTANWSEKENGKFVGYAFAGEIYFVVTKDRVYFEITRHF